ncbi:MAG: hypothetical protein JKX71_09965 [Amylibacter sp.]|nr:hypothetical protein [Amylibacter sp.]
MIEEFEVSKGCQLLSRWQANDKAALDRLRAIFDAAIAGEFDAEFARPTEENAVNIGGSLNLMTLTIMNDLYGYESAEFYKGDAERYVRTTLLSRRLLGMNKLYVSWPVYGFTAEAMGQAIMYPDRFPPGADPDNMLLNKDNWQDIQTPDFDSGIPKIMTDIIATYERLTGLEPILHLSAAYSLAADTFGQEPLLAALVHDPDFANELLDKLTDKVIQPWADHFFKRFPNGWLELSDASGSPFFIGPQNCKNMAIRSTRRLVDENPWGARVYDANFRGDYVTLAEKKNRSSRRRGASNDTPKPISLHEMTDLKHSVCRDYIMRLDDDRVPMPFYEEQAIARNVPLFLGIGAGQIDRNSIKNMEAVRVSIQDTADTYTAAIKNVAQSISKNGYDNKMPPWPGTMYFEDISSESSFELIGILIKTALSDGALDLS